eukprot:804595_1
MSQFTLVRCGTLQTINLFPSGVLPAFDEVVNIKLLGAVESDKVVWVRPLCHNDNCLCHNEVDVPIDSRAYQVSRLLVFIVRQNRAHSSHSIYQMDDIKKGILCQLLCGDPRGKGSSAVGLVLESGALVLSDRGICCIGDRI